MVTGTCALCGENKSLSMSHIIPNFVFKWMKESSATGFLRSAENPEKRLQDFAKLPFLCLECEQLFSKFESYFAKQVFFPVLNKKIIQVSYDEKLLGFIISLSWRTLKKTYATNCTQHPWIKEHLDMAEKIWRDYLLGVRKDVLPYETYMLFMDSLPEILESPPSPQISMVCLS